MSTVQALTELSHRADEVAAFCRETGEPTQVTHLAGDDLVLMSVEAYRRQRELAVSEARRQAAEGARRPLLEAGDGGRLAVLAVFAGARAGGHGPREPGPAAEEARRPLLEAARRPQICRRPAAE